MGELNSITPSHLSSQSNYGAKKNRCRRYVLLQIGCRATRRERGDTRPACDVPRGSNGLSGPIYRLVHGPCAEVSLPPLTVTDSRTFQTEVFIFNPPSFKRQVFFFFLTVLFLSLFLSSSFSLSFFFQFKTRNDEERC